jgi:hypothetical protein
LVSVLESKNIAEQEGEGFRIKSDPEGGENMKEEENLTEVLVNIMRVKKKMFSQEDAPQVVKPPDEDRTIFSGRQMSEKVEGLQISQKARQ